VVEGLPSMLKLERERARERETENAQLNFLTTFCPFHQVKPPF
jgi:hypothetical protein